MKIKKCLGIDCKRVNVLQYAFTLITSQLFLASAVNRTDRLSEFAARAWHYRYQVLTHIVKILLHLHHHGLTLVPVK